MKRFPKANSLKKLILLISFYLSIFSLYRLFPLNFFRGKSITAKVQRSLTGSQYGKFCEGFSYNWFLDHVALILRFGSNDLVLLEATENNVLLKFSLKLLI